MNRRCASHAGSWYSDHAGTLDAQLASWVADASATTTSDPTTTVSAGTVRAIIAPHAGYSYSGPAAAHAYFQWALNKDLIDQIQTIFILGPSHHVYLKGIAVSGCSVYDTPLGSLHIDTDINEHLKQTGKFSVMTQKVDEDEHSIEMHLPYVYKILEQRLKKIISSSSPTSSSPPPPPVKIVPLLVGELSSSAASSTYAPLLAPLLLSPTSLTIISSDFCHWGRRFNYTYVPPPIDAPIHTRIAALDTAAMKSIEANDGGDAFRAYLADTGNTVCGRNPILMLLAVLRHARESAVGVGGGDGGTSSRISFVHYSQSSAVVRPDDSSVSYASAICRI